MPAIVLLGAQWGDEGKGKATDLLGSSVDYVVKFNGGNNAGHTVVIGDEKYALHLLPSRHPHARASSPSSATASSSTSRCCSARSTASRRAASTRRGCWSAPTRTSSRRTTARSTRSPSASSASASIGTTGRGIGPTYADKINRVGIRVQDLFDEKILRQKVEGALEQKNHLLVKVYNRRAITVDEVVEESCSYADRLRPMVADTVAAARPGARRRQDRAARGRPGDAARRRPRHLSVRHVVQPDGRRRVHRLAASRRPASTASSRSSRPTRPASAPARSRPSCSTRTASGCATTAPSSAPPPAARAAAAGTTPSIARYAARINGVTDFVLTKLDVLTGWERIPVCVAYDVDGVRHDEMPMTQTDFHHAKPIYEYFAGWDEDITGARTFDDLPKNAQDYVLALEEMSGAPISAIGVGPGRDETVEIRSLSAAALSDHPSAVFPAAVTRRKVAGFATVVRQESRAAPQPRPPRLAIVAVAACRRPLRNPCRRCRCSAAPSSRSTRCSPVGTRTWWIPRTPARCRSRTPRRQRLPARRLGQRRVRDRQAGVGQDRLRLHRHDDQFEQVMAYYWVTQAQLYIQSLGFGSTLPAVNKRQQLVRINQFGGDNSFYRNGTKKLTITFGKGGVDDAEDAEVVVHEYGHSVQDDQVPGFGSWRRPARSVRRSATTWRSRSGSGRRPATGGPKTAACVADWDSVSYTSTCRTACAGSTDMTVADARRGALRRPDLVAGAVGHPDRSR